MARGGADIGGIIKIAAIGVGGYFLYDWWTKRTPSTTPTSTAPGSSNTPNAIDALFQKLAPTLGGKTLTADGFNFSLQAELPPGKTAPAPETFLPSGVARDATMTFGQYWTAITPALKTTLGLSGLGLYEGLYRAYQAKQRIAN